ncbi:MAG: class I SAM-dependent methyltransferase, partial [Thermoanaerobaculia bacterium]
MKNGPHPPRSRFDAFSHDYDVALSAGLSLSGETPVFFAEQRVKWLARRLREMDLHPRAVLDYGCGKGSATPFFFEQLRVDRVTGVDASDGLLEVARATHSSDRVAFLSRAAYRPAAREDLVFCNGVFHHVAPSDRPAEISAIFESLRPGGFFALWENNPWNPAARLVMSRVAFDADAVTLTPPEARRLVRRGGFEVMRTDFLFIFPRFLRWLRAVEPALARYPLGAQYQLLCRRPAGADRG